MADISKPFRLGYGNKPDSSPTEKPLTPKIEFYAPTSEVGYFEFNGTDWDVYVEGVQTGSIPGAGGGGTGGISGVIGSVGGVNLQVGDTIQARVLFGAEFDTWRLDCYPSGTVTVEVDVNGSTISTGGHPSVTASTTATGNTASWSGNSVAEDNVILFRIASLSGLIERVECALYGDKT